MTLLQVFQHFFEWSTKCISANFFLFERQIKIIAREWDQSWNTEQETAFMEDSHWQASVAWKCTIVLVAIAPNSQTSEKLILDLRLIKYISGELALGT